jgi:hypothetical protein
MRRILSLFLVSAALFALFTACGRNSYKADISRIEAEIDIRRLEQDLFTISPGTIADSTGYLKRKYGQFLQYFSYVINIGEISDSLWAERLVEFCTDRQNNEVFAAVESVFGDIGDLENGLRNAFRHYLYYFPQQQIPAVYTCITGFNNSIITGDSVLGISLDRYLGSENRFYSELGIYRYETVKMNPGNILRDCIYAWASSEYEISRAGYASDNVLTEIIHEGKLHYYTRCMLPDEREDLLFGFTGPQVEFCHNNEGRMWQYLVENRLLFSTDQLTRRKLTGESPFTSYFSSESPGRAAVWLGFRIVESYMSRNRDVSLPKLMNENDIQKILEKSGYRPAV